MLLLSAGEPSSLPIFWADYLSFSVMRNSMLPDPAWGYCLHSQRSATHVRNATPLTQSTQRNLQILSRQILVIKLPICWSDHRVVFWLSKWFHHFRSLVSCKHASFYIQPPWYSVHKAKLQKKVRESTIVPALLRLRGSQTSWDTATLALTELGCFEVGLVRYGQPSLC